MPIATLAKSPQRRAAPDSGSNSTRNEKINYKVREHSLAKIPVLLVVGKEAENRAVSIRRLGSQEQKVMGLEVALIELAAEAVAPNVRRGSHSELCNEALG